MGQDTYCVMGASAPVAFTFENWQIYRDILFNSGLDETDLFILFLNDFLPRESDGCHNLAYHILQAFNNYDDPQIQITPTEFKSCVGSLTSNLREWKWLPADKEFIGMELQIMVEITCCHVRGLTMRKNPRIFNQEASYSLSWLETITTASFDKLTKVGISKEKISINHYMWDSQ